MHHKTIATCLTFTLGVGVSLTLSPELAYGEEADDQRLIEEITVTARRRTESSQDVPVPVTAFSGEKLEKHFAATIEDFNHSIPNVQIKHVALNIPLIDDKLALRLTALSQNLDGFYENAETVRT